MSADKSLPEDEEEAEPSKFDQWMTRVFGENAMNYLMVIAGTLGVLIAIGLFFFLPSRSFNLIYNYTGIGDGFLPCLLYTSLFYRNSGNKVLVRFHHIEFQRRIELPV